MLSKLGHNVIWKTVISKNKKRTISKKFIDSVKPDLIWFSNPFLVESNKKAIDYARNKKIKTVVYSSFHVGIPYTSWGAVWKRIDYIFIHHTGCVNWLKSHGYNGYFMPLAFYPNQYYKTSLGKKYDVSFCGNSLTEFNTSKDKRVKYLKSIKDFYPAVYGYRFRSKLKKVKEINVYDYGSHNTQRKVYGKTKINLDLPFFNSTCSFYKNDYHMKNRLFEVPATGNFLLTVRHPEFVNIFDETMVGYYDDNIESLKENIEKYLVDEKLRKSMAARAYKVVNEKHTFLHRFKDMLNIIER